jgi:endonuclease G
VFTAATGNDIYYPMDNSAVDFIAYYPHEDAVTLNTPIDVIMENTQTTANQPTFDLLWTKADNGGNGYNKDATQAQLEFNHKLAKIVFNTSAAANVGTPLTGMTVTMNGMNTAGKFDLATGAFTGTAGTPAAISARTATDGAVYDAIILPGSYAADAIELNFTIGSETFTSKMPAVTFESGNEYVYSVTLTRTGVVISTSNIKPWTTIPSGNLIAD